MGTRMALYGRVLLARLFQFVDVGVGFYAIFHLFTAQMAVLAPVDRKNVRWYYFIGERPGGFGYGRLCIGGLGKQSLVYYAKSGLVVDDLAGLSGHSGEKSTGTPHLDDTKLCPHFIGHYLAPHAILPGDVHITRSCRILHIGGLAKLVAELVYCGDITLFFGKMTFNALVFAKWVFRVVEGVRIKQFARRVGNRRKCRLLLNGSVLDDRRNQTDAGNGRQAGRKE